jgi:hypothetical protein
VLGFLHVAVRSGKSLDYGCGGAGVELRLEGIVAIVGSYGSGKSEVAIHLAVHHRLQGTAVRLADIDLVNPYFRSREARGPLAELGIEVVLPPEIYLQADLPVLSPLVAGIIRQTGGLTLLDAGGDPVGGRVLAALGDAFAGRAVQVLQVVNPLRPATGTLAGCLRVLREIECASKLAVSGLIGNANLIDETTAREITEGYHFMRRLAEESRLPLVCVTAAEELMGELNPADFVCPLLALRRQLVPPWKKAQSWKRDVNEASRGRVPSGRWEEPNA